MANAKIIGTGVYVPEKIITNDDRSNRLGEDITEFLTQNLGIYERHIAAEKRSSARPCFSYRGRSALGSPAASLVMYSVSSP